MTATKNIQFALAAAALFGASTPLAKELLGQVSPWLLAGLLYGFSLILFVLALRGLGTSRTGAYFSTAPFIGAAIAIAFFGDQPSPFFWIAAVLMGVGVWLHLTERHEHEHTHEPVAQGNYRMSMVRPAIFRAQDAQ